MNALKEFEVSHGFPCGLLAFCFVFVASSWLHPTMQGKLELPSLRFILGDVFEKFDMSYDFFGEYASDAWGFRELLGLYEGIVGGEGVLRFFLKEERKRDRSGESGPGLETSLEKTISLYVPFKNWNLDRGSLLLTFLRSYGGMSFQEPLSLQYSCWRDGELLIKIRIIDGDAWKGMIDGVWGTHMLNVVTWKGMYCMMPMLTLSWRVLLRWDERDERLGGIPFAFDEVFRDRLPESVGELKGRRWFGDSYCLEYSFSPFRGNFCEWVDPLEGRSLRFE